MRYFLLLLALMLAPLARADKVWVDNVGNVMRLMDAPCTNAEVLSHMPQNIRADLRAGTARVDGKVHQVCWRELSGTTYYIRYDDGDYSIVQRSRFDASRNRT